MDNLTSPSSCHLHWRNVGEWPVVAIRTNNNVEGMHNWLNQQARRGNAISACNAAVPRGGFRVCHVSWCLNPISVRPRGNVSYTRVVISSDSSDMLNNLKLLKWKKYVAEIGKMTSQTHSYVAVTDRVKIGIFHLQQLHRKNRSYLFLRFLYKSKWRLTAPTLALLVLIALILAFVAALKFDFSWRAPAHTPLWEVTAFR